MNVIKWKNSWQKAKKGTLGQGLNANKKKLNKSKSKGGPPGKKKKKKENNDAIFCNLTCKDCGDIISQLHWSSVCSSVFPHFLFG